MRGKNCSMNVLIQRLQLDNIITSEIYISFQGHQNIYNEFAYMKTYWLLNIWNSCFIQYNVQPCIMILIFQDLLLFFDGAFQYFPINTTKAQLIEREIAQKEENIENLATLNFCQNCTNAVICWLLTKMPKTDVMHERNSEWQIFLINSLSPS